MIQFFRHIRQGHINQERVGKYLLYAIGEIMLVVIGIILALQINNWNESNKQAKKEQVLLTEVLESLKKDLGRTQYIYNRRALRKQEAISQLINDIHKEQLPPDSVMRRNIRHSTMTLSFIYDKGAYESLKSYGIDLVRNDSLRQHIVRMYENDLPLGVVFIDDNRETQSQMRNELLNQIRNFNFVQSSDDSWYGTFNIDYSTLKNNEAFKRLMSLETAVASNYIRRLEDKISDFEKLIYQIERELNGSVSE